MTLSPTDERRMQNLTDVLHAVEEITILPGETWPIYVSQRATPERVSREYACILRALAAMESKSAGGAQ